MACLKGDGSNESGLEMRLYITFNHQGDDAARSCPSHLESIIEILRRVPYEPPAMDGSPKLIAQVQAEPDRNLHSHSQPLIRYLCVSR